MKEKLCIRKIRESVIILEDGGWDEDKWRGLEERAE